MSSSLKVQFAVLLLLLAFYSPTLAQREGPTESLDIVKDFDARLLDANKIKITPYLPALDTSAKAQNYEVPPRPLTVSYDAPKLRPIGMKTVGKEDSYNGFAKIGAGLPTSLYGEAGYYYKQDEKFDARAWFRHHSMNNKSIENQRFTNNDLSLSGNLYLPSNLAAEAKMGYSADRVHFYGYNRDTFSFDAEGVRQHFRTFDLGGRVYNSERTSADLNYFITPKFYLLNDFYSNRELGFDFGFGATKWFAEKHPLTLKIRTDFTNYNDTAVQKLNNIYLQPSFTFHADAFKIKIGGNFASNRDVFYIFPDVEATLRIWGDGIQAFAGASGDLRKNTYRSISEYNPFVQMRGSKLRNTEYRNYYGGVKGSFGWLEYSGQAGYANARNLALYQTLFTTVGIERAQLTRFRVLYDTANIINLQGTIKFTILKDLVISGTLSQNAFDLSNETGAWGLPGLEGNFSAAYKLLEGKATAKAELYIADRITHLTDRNRKGEGGALYDLSLSGQYQFAEQIGAFLDINNLLNNRRERWHNYPIFGVNVMVGITAKF